MKVLVSQMKDYIAMPVETLDKKTMFDDQIRWLSIHYSVFKNREFQKIRLRFLNKIQGKTKATENGSIKVVSLCKWNEEGEKN